MNSTDQLRRELLEEEMAILEFYISRHRRWKITTDNPDINRQHRIIADQLTDVVQLCGQLAEQLKIAIKEQ